MSLRVARLLLPAVLLAGLVWGGISTSDEGVASKGSETDSPEAVVRRLLNEAIATLEAGDILKYYTHYAPAADFRRMREPEMLKLLAAKNVPPQARQHLLGVLKSFQDGKVEFEADGLLAKISRKETEPEPKLTESVVEIPKPEDDQLKLAGYGDDLEKVIDAALTALETGELENFIDRLFPAGELGLLKLNDGKAKLLARLKDHPEMVDKMRGDLQALKAVSPEFNADKTLATFVVPVPAEVPADARVKKPKPLDKTFKFQKVAGSWRFFDNSTPLRKEMARQTLLNPPSAKPLPVQRDLILEKLGSCWRIARYPDL